MRVAAVVLATMTLAACATAGGPGHVERAAPVAAPSPAEQVAEATSWAVRCDQGFAIDCRKLGRAYLGGAGFAADDRLAAALLIKGCEMGEAASCSDLGVLTLIGRGVTQDDAAAGALTRRACDAGNALACSNLGVLTVRKIGGAAAGGDEPVARGRRLLASFQKGCEAGFLEGCLDVGTAKERGELVPRDPTGAARAYQHACRGGLAIGCHRLALLAADAPEAVREIDAAALRRAACQAGIAPDCGAGEAPGPAGPMTPTPGLVSERASFALGIPGSGGFHPDDLAARPAGPGLRRELLRRLPVDRLAGLAEPLRHRLEESWAPVEALEPDEAVELLLRLRRPQLATCLERERSQPGATQLAVAFLIESNGTPGELHAATEPVEPSVEACAVEVMQGWTFPMPAGGVSGPYLVRFDYEAPPPGATPRYGFPGVLRAALLEPGCLERNLRVPPTTVGTTNAVTVRLAIDPAGKPALLHALTPAPEPLVAAIAEAARACAYRPGVGEDGRPVALWLTLTVRVEGR